MSTTHFSVPTPDLRIVHVAHIHPHEEHDSQRALPLIKRLEQAEFLTNPPIVAPIDHTEFVVLDGANRYHAFCHLGYECILVQVAPYDSGFVDLHVWQHIISHWSADDLLTATKDLVGITLVQGWLNDAIARIVLKNGVIWSLQSDVDALGQRNEQLREFVRLYQKSARLDRTTLEDVDEIWQLYPNATALIRFPHYLPQHIMTAAVQKAFIPPGISRHLVHGRALQLNYPLQALRDNTLTLTEKNQKLEQWILQKFAERAVRFYGESTYQFNE